jgi:hypothetical protein
MPPKTVRSLQLEGTSEDSLSRTGGLVCAPRASIRIRSIAMQCGEMW